MAMDSNTSAHHLHSTIVDLPSGSKVVGGKEIQEKRIHIRSAGPARLTRRTPAVIFVTGAGSACLSFSTVQRKLADAGHFSFTYDRQGIGRSSPLPAFSEPGRETTKKPKGRSAVELAEELHEVLQTASMEPPYVVVAHSYAGVIACEYLALQPQNVVGLVFVDANYARSPDRPLRDSDFEALVEGCDGNFDYWRATGMNESHQLLTDEWSELKGERPPGDEWPKGENGGSAEGQLWEASCRAVGQYGQTKKHVFANYPVSVVKGRTERDFRLIADEFDKLGGGTEEKLQAFRQTLNGLDEIERDMQKEFLQLTSEGMGRMVTATESGHYVQLTQPEVVVEEIEWVLQQLKDKNLLV